MSITICITGTSRGIGKALARECLLQGYRVFTCARNLSQINDLENEFPKHCIPIKMDVTNEQSVQESKTAILRHTSCIDILVNNAAIHTGDAVPELSAINTQELTDSFEVNTTGVLRVIKMLHSLLKKSKHPKIVNISSIMGSIAQVVGPRNYAYSVSKAALNMLTKILDHNLTPEGFLVFCMHPGWVRTDMGGPHAPYSPEQSAQGILKQILNKSDHNDLFLDFQGTPLDW